MFRANDGGSINLVIEQFDDKKNPDRGRHRNFCSDGCSGMWF